VRLAHQFVPSSETASSKPRERNHDETSLITSTPTPRAYVSLTGSFRNTGPAERVIIRLMTDPILRATDLTGEVYNDPSEDALFMLMEDLAPSAVLRVERLEEGRQDDWALVTMDDARLYSFESSGHIEYLSSLREIHNFLTRWAFDLSGS
jgi:hypothetical protein